MFKEITIFFTAIAFFTRIPCYKLANFSSEYLNKSAKYLPLVGWIVGGFGALIYLLANLVLPHSVSILLSMISTILLTGAFHEDGFADSCDGFGGGNTKEKILSIMKDSRVGTYGVLGITLLLGLKYLCLLEMDWTTLPLVLIAGHSISRFTAVSFMFTHNYARENDETSKACHVSQIMGMSDFLISMILGILPVLLLGYVYLLILIPIFIIRQILSYYLSKKIGGYTGDSLGAVQQITEVVFYIIILVEPWKYI